MEYSELKLIKKKTKYANEDNYVSLAETCLQLGELYKDREEPQRALNEYKLAAKAYEKLNRTMDRGLAYRMVGEMHSLLGQFKEALQNVQAYMRAARKEANQKALQEAHVTLGRVYLNRAECYRKESKTTDAEADLSEAEKSFRTALAICNDLHGTVRKSDLINMQAGTHLNLGITLDYQGKKDLAQEQMERAIRLSKDADLFELLYTCYNTMALCSSKWESLEGGEHSGQTLRLLNQALEVASRLSNRSSKMCQTLMLMAKFFLKMDDFQSARQALKRAYRLKTPVANDMKWIERKLKLLVAMCRMEDELVTIDATNYARRKELYERMGDGACRLRNFTKAIDYYLRMLQSAEALGEADRQLLPCYVSLYLTYSDNRQYDQALEYLWKEYNIIDNDPSEAYHTLMKIAKLYERQKQSFFEIQNIYMRARDEAKKLQSIELQRLPVQRAIKMLRANFMDLMAEKLEQEASEEGLTDLNVAEPDSEEFPDRDHSVEIVDFDGEEEEEDDENNTSNVGDEIDLKVDLSDDSDDSQRPTTGEDTTSSSATGPSRSRKRGKRFVLRRNKKGETQLHQAAISGNRELAVRLLDLGHPVNERDYAGWLPLHEACIHGHSDIVSLLLDRGAYLNDKGGTSCEGITPLHDACRNGHLNVIEVLLNRGANATQRNDYGETALSMLDMCLEKITEPLSSAESNQHKRIRERLVAQFEAAAIPISSPPTRSDTMAPSSGGKRPTRKHLSSGDLEIPSTVPSSLSPSRSSRWTNTGSSGYVSEISTSIRHRNSICDADDDKCNTDVSSPENDCDDIGRRKSSTGVSEYRNVMEAMRKTKPNELRSQTTSQSAQNRRQARRIIEEDDSEDDDWLIDDMKRSVKKSRVTRDLHRTSLEGGLERKKSSSSLVAVPPSRNNVVDRHHVEPMSLNDPTTRLDALIDSDDNLEEDLDRDEDFQQKGNKGSAFNVLMSNSARSFRRTQSRRNSSESRSTSFVRRHSNLQSSLLDAGFQRVASPTLDEKENLVPPSSASSRTPIKHSVGNSYQQMPSSEAPPHRTIQVIFDTGDTYNVNYDEQLILTTQTIGWLRNVVAREYMMRHGKRPTIKLKPADGSAAAENSFFDSDTVHVLLKNGAVKDAVVYAQAHGWERINLELFHDEYCEEHNIVNDKDLRKRFITMERNQLIVLEPDFAFTVPSVSIPPAHVHSMLFMAIFFQHDWMNHLDLSMNSITDEDMEKLVRYLPSCRNLRILRLRMNLLTSRSIEMLCFGGKSPSDNGCYTANITGSLGGGLLAELDLSHNPLEDTALDALSRLCNSLPSLRILRIRSTDITVFNTAGHSSIDISRLETFDISENKLTERSVQCLLLQLAESRLREAHFSSLPVQCTDFKPKLWQTITEHRLEGLRLINLSNCRLTDDEVESSLLPAIGQNCAALTRLDLSLNVALTKRTLLSLLRHCATAVYRLEEVRFDHDVQLLVDLDTIEPPDRLMQLIEYSPTARYPQQIHAVLPVSGYTSERRGTLLATLADLWRTLWPLNHPHTTRHENGLQITFTVDPTG